MHKPQKSHICFQMTQYPQTFKNSPALLELRNKDESKTTGKTEELIRPK